MFLFPVCFSLRISVAQLANAGECRLWRVSPEESLFCHVVVEQKTHLDQRRKKKKQEKKILICGEKRWQFDEG